MVSHPIRDIKFSHATVHFTNNNEGNSSKGIHIDLGMIFKWEKYANNFVWIFISTPLPAYPPTAIFLSDFEGNL